MIRSLIRQAGKAARALVAGLSLTAAGLVGVVVKEGWCNPACIPTKGDKRTLGFGSTTRPDGSPVKLGDTTTPVKALQRTLAYLQAAEADMKATLDGVYLHQAEYELYLDWRYQYGAGAWANSSMLRHLRAGRHVQACQALLLYKYSAGHDCSVPGNRICPGVWTRQLERHKKCMEVQ